MFIPIRETNRDATRQFVNESLENNPFPFTKLPGAGFTRRAIDSRYLLIPLIILFIPQRIAYLRGFRFGIHQARYFSCSPARRNRREHMGQYVYIFARDNPLNKIIDPHHVSDKDISLFLTHLGIYINVTGTYRITRDTGAPRSTQKNRYLFHRDTHTYINIITEHLLSDY